MTARDPVRPDAATRKQMRDYINRTQPGLLTGLGMNDDHAYCEGCDFYDCCDNPYNCCCRREQRHD